MVAAALVEFGNLNRKSRVQFNEFYNLTDRSREGLVIVKPKLDSQRNNEPKETKFSVRFANKIVRRILGKRYMHLATVNAVDEEAQRTQNLSKSKRILNRKLFEEVKLDFND